MITPEGMVAGAGEERTRADEPACEAGAGAAGAEVAIAPRPVVRAASGGESTRRSASLPCPKVAVETVGHE